jgi:glyoxylate reductase
MEKKKIFITRKIAEKGIKMLNRYETFDIDMNNEDRVLSKEELTDRVRGANAIISLLTDKIDGEVMDAAGDQLKIIANYAVGFDNIDIEEAKKRNIFVSNTPEVMTQAVAEHAMALITACARRIVEGDEFVRQGKYKQWEPDLLLGPEIAGKTLGIVGIGRIGMALANIAYHGYGIKVLYSDLNVNEEVERNLQADRVSLDTLLERSDFVSVHVPLLPSTHHLIGAPELKLMKKSAILVNTARGAVIDEKALFEALKDRQIFAAGLDVYEFEPNPVEGLTQLQNVVFTPHIASATEEARESMSECVAENVISVMHGTKPKSPVF